MKGYEVSLVDFKGGVDYGPVWERHARLISDNQEFLAAIRELVEEKDRRLAFLRQNDASRIDEYRRI